MAASANPFARVRPERAVPAWVVVILAGCARAPGPPDLLLVTIDTLPADRVGCYGSPDVRTPAMDRLARGGLLVRDAISPAPLTLPSHATMLTGLDPAAHGVRDNGLFALDFSFDTVPELLPSDLRKAAFIGAYPLHRRFHLTQGFDVYDDVLPESPNPYRRPQRRARGVFRRAAEWLERADDGQASFAWIHVFDPHFPYAPPDEWPLLAERPDSGAYECEVAYTDHELHRFLQRLALRERPAPNVLLVSDHGESLGRHGEDTHGLFVYDATQRVPLILAGPAAHPAIGNGPRGLVDVAPTLLALAGAPPCPAHEGTSLLQPPADDGAYVEDRNTEYFHGWSSLYGFRTAEWKYVRAPRPELYDLLRDPGETVNRIDERPDVAAELSARVDEILARAKDPTLEEVDPGVVAKLQSLGYLATIEPGTVSHSGEDPKDHVASVVAMCRGQEAYLDGDLADARRWLERSLQLDPGLKRAHSYLAGTYLRLRQYDACIREARAFLDTPPFINEAPIHVVLGEAYLATGRTDSAVEHLRAAVDADPENRRATELLETASRPLN